MFGVLEDYHFYEVIDKVVPGFILSDNGAVHYNDKDEVPRFYNDTSED
jgi:hypothetical protein